MTANQQGWCMTADQQARNKRVRSWYAAGNHSRGRRKACAALPPPPPAIWNRQWQQVRPQPARTLLPRNRMSTWLNWKPSCPSASDQLLMPPLMWNCARGGGEQRGSGRSGKGRRYSPAPPVPAPAPTLLHSPERCMPPPSTDAHPSILQAGAARPRRHGARSSAPPAHLEWPHHALQGDLAACLVDHQVLTHWDVLESPVLGGRAEAEVPGAVYAGAGACTQRTWRGVLYLGMAGAVLITCTWVGAHNAPACSLFCSRYTRAPSTIWGATCMLRQARRLCEQERQTPDAGRMPALMRKPRHAARHSGTHLLGGSCLAQQLQAWIDATGLAAGVGVESLGLHLGGRCNARIDGSAPCADVIANDKPAPLTPARAPLGSPAQHTATNPSSMCYNSARCGTHPGRSGQQLARERLRAGSAGCGELNASVPARSWRLRSAERSAWRGSRKKRPG